MTKGSTGLIPTRNDPSWAATQQAASENSRQNIKKRLQRVMIILSATRVDITLLHSGNGWRVLWWGSAV